MRSTLTLDPDVAHQIKERVATSRKSFKAVVNDLLRQGLAKDAPINREPFVQQTYALGWNETLDPTGFNRLADALSLEGDLDVLRRFEATR